MTDESEDADAGAAAAGAGASEDPGASQDTAPQFKSAPPPPSETPVEEPVGIDPDGPDEPGLAGDSSGLRIGDAIQPDAVADLFDDHPAGIAAFKAFVSETYTCSADPERPMRRLYTDDTGWEWVEVAADDVRAQMPVNRNPNDPRSLVFVRKDALVTMCRVDYASQVKDQAFGVDPRGGPNPPRRPPY